VGNERPSFQPQGTYSKPQDLGFAWGLGILLLAFVSLFLFGKGAFVIIGIFGPVALMVVLFIMRILPTTGLQAILIVTAVTAGFSAFFAVYHGMIGVGLCLAGVAIVVAFCYHKPYPPGSPQAQPIEPPADAQAQCGRCQGAFPEHLLKYYCSDEGLVRWSYLRLLGLLNWLVGLPFNATLASPSLRGLHCEECREILWEGKWTLLGLFLTTILAVLFAVLAMLFTF
jgi:hypothetical protein